MWAQERRQCLDTTQNVLEAQSCLLKEQKLPIINRNFHRIWQWFNGPCVSQKKYILHVFCLISSLTWTGTFKISECEPSKILQWNGNTNKTRAFTMDIEKHRLRTVWSGAERMQARWQWPETLHSFSQPLLQLPYEQLFSMWVKMIWGLKMIGFALIPKGETLLPM